MWGVWHCLQQAKVKNKSLFFPESLLPSCGSVFSFYTTLQLCSCLLPEECVYNSRLSPFARQSSSSSSVSLATLHGPDCILAERSAGHATPCRSFFLCSSASCLKVTTGRAGTSDLSTCRGNTSWAGP